jgi:hypothetical protein
VGFKRFKSKVRSVLQNASELYTVQSKTKCAALLDNWL